MTPAPLSPAHLAAYCARIGYAGALNPDLATLRAIHAAHCAAIPFENIDVQLGLPPTLDPEAAFAKLVTAGRGGWCYEHNGVLGRALAAIGFAVTRLCGGVLRDDSGLPAMGSHLALLVSLDRPWLVDAGFSSWLSSPLPLESGAWSQPPWTVTLSSADIGAWTLAVDLGSRVMQYHFAATPADEALLAQVCAWQASNPASPFVQNLVVQRRADGIDLALRGRVLVETTVAGAHQRLIADADDLVAVLRDRFVLNVPHAAQIWPTVAARHAALFPDQAVAPTT
ncbi:arylamine N-acetyltransferase [Novosphingobium sp.]|uniref:arylamine N-acetyltransferase family protein n=1 Tax=Novosphingobium sp. TaxID=1874826 RepID=UPI0033426EEE